MKSNIYIPSLNADGALCLLIGLVSCLVGEQFKKVVFVGDKDYYAKFFSPDQLERIQFLWHSPTDNGAFLKDLTALLQSEPDALFVVSFHVVEPGFFGSSKVIYQDYRCLCVNQIDSDWDVFLPPLLDWQSPVIREALNESGKVIHKSHTTWKIKPHLSR